LIRFRLVSSAFGELSKRRRTFAQQFVFSVGTNDLFVQLPVRTVASLPRVPEVSRGIRSSRSCKPDSEFGGRSAVPTLYNLAWNSSVRSVRSLRFQEFPNAYFVSVENMKQAKLIRSVLMVSSYRSYAFVLSFVKVLRWGRLGRFVWGISV